ncbi:MAG: hypothetical protein PVI90_12890, partial [Desulfobacteraceae bacterium]|jgi:glyoxylase-like metal-dependent hydrolase (beta-lactamase superfamily II)
VVYLFDSIAIVGDAVLNGIFQTPMLDLDFGTNKERFNNYQAYCNSLNTFKLLRNYQCFSSHGKPLKSIDQGVNGFVKKIWKRSIPLKDFLKKNNSIMQILTELFPDCFEQPFKAFIKLSEILFLMDYLKSSTHLTNALKTNGFIVSK